MPVQLFEDSARALRRGLTGLAAAGLLSLALVGGAAAEDDVAAAGNGGVAGAAANGGVVAVGDVNSGGNGSGLMLVGDTYDGAVAVDGGEVSATTVIAAETEGGVGVADASGGDENVAVEADLD